MAVERDDLQEAHDLVERLYRESGGNGFFGVENENLTDQLRIAMDALDEAMGFLTRRYRVTFYRVQALVTTVEAADEDSAFEAAEENYQMGDFEVEDDDYETEFNTWALFPPEAEEDD